jgi:hypothetical protein
MSILRTSSVKASLGLVPALPVSVIDVEPIHRKSVCDAVINARPNRDGDDGRSQWFRFTLSNGDVIFGCFPQGDNALAVIDNLAR